MFHPSLVVSPILILICRCPNQSGKASVFASPDHTIDGRRVMRRY
jgi:hypothetical protein